MSWGIIRGSSFELWFGPNGVTIKTSRERVSLRLCPIIAVLWWLSFVSRVGSVYAPLVDQTKIDRMTWRILIVLSIARGSYLLLLQRFSIVLPSFFEMWEEIFGHQLYLPNPDAYTVSRQKTFVPTND